MFGLSMDLCKHRKYLHPPHMRLLAFDRVVSCFPQTSRFDGTIDHSWSITIPAGTMIAYSFCHDPLQFRRLAVHAKLYCNAFLAVRSSVLAFSSHPQTFTFTAVSAPWQKT